MKIAHIADLHLDAAHLENSLGAFRFAADTAIERGCDGFVIAGDLWHRSVTLDAMSPVLQAVRIVRDIAARMPVIICGGNHDRPGSLQVFAELREAYPIIVADTQPMTVQANSIVYSILPYPTKAFLVSRMTGSQEDTDRVLSDAIRAIVAGFAAEYVGECTRGPAFAAGSPHVLVFHGNVTGSATETGQVMLGGDVMVSAADLEACGADYIALGHIHKRQLLGTRCWYPGSTYHTNFGEVDPRYMHIVGLACGTDPVVKAVRLPSRPKVVLDLLPDGTAAEPYSPSDIEDCDVKIRVRMTEEEAKTFDEAAVRAVIERHAHSARVERIVLPRERVRAEAITETHALADKVQTWAEAVGETVSEAVYDKARVLEGGVA